MKYFLALAVAFSSQVNAANDELLNASKLIVEKLSLESQIVAGIKHASDSQPFEVPAKFTECVIEGVKVELPKIYAQVATESNTTASVLEYGELFSTPKGDRFLAIVNKEVPFSSVSNAELKSFEKYHQHREAIFKNGYAMEQKIYGLMPGLQKTCGQYLNR